MAEHRGRPSWSLSLDRYVAAPPQVVWDVVTDLEGTTPALPGVVSVERLSDDGPGGYAPGTRWRETRRMFGQDATEEMTVVEAEAPRRTVLHAEHGSVRYVTGFELAPAGNGAAAGEDDAPATLLRFHFAAEQTGPARTLRDRLERALAALAAPLGAAATRASVRTELAAIADLAESRAPQA